MVALEKRMQINMFNHVSVIYSFSKPVYPAPRLFWTFVDTW